MGTVMDDRKMINFAVSGNDKISWENLAKIERELLKRIEELETRVETRFTDAAHLQKQNAAPKKD
jgi:hypothetical protein